MEDLKHALVGQASLRFENLVAVPGILKNILVETVGGHHGAFSQSDAARYAFRLLQKEELGEWREFRSEGIAVLQDYFQFDTSPLNPDEINVSTAVIALTGFTILCDWIGSNSVYFNLEPNTPYETYARMSYERAWNGVKNAGFMQPFKSSHPVVFSKLFSNISAPRPLQTAVDSIPDAVLSKPCLVVIEAPTGEGKTEAALAIAHRIGALQGTDEFYYALPTTATSNQMYVRIQKYLRDQLNITTQTRLVHGQAFLMQDALSVQPMQNGELDEEHNNSMEWFSSKKRALLAPFGVGTVDQSELGALNVKHNCLRLVGLAGKVLVLDEIHAYDTYMTAIIARLLKWLSALGTSVILLSATLPRSRRTALAEAYGAKLPSDAAQLDGYPLIYSANSDIYSIEWPGAAQENRRILISSLHLAEDSPDQKAHWLVDQLGDRGCLCWITNTVQRAQDLFRQLDEIAPPDVIRILIHSRYPMVERECIEKQLAEHFGPQGNRPLKAIVIGTQVLEQSLDLDFDCMVTDLAPVDLLLQRAGRLHRHSWRDMQTRGDHIDPHLYIYEHHTLHGELDLSIDKYVYAEYFLKKTYQELSDRREIVLPADYRELISLVYDALPPTKSDSLFSAWQDLQKSQVADSLEAQIRLLPEPSDQEFCLGARNFTFDEDEDKAGWSVAKTRLGEESITVIPLKKMGDEVFSPAVVGPIPLDQPANQKIQNTLMRTNMKISGRELCAAVRNASGTRKTLFLKSALLKHVYPLWIDDPSQEYSAFGQTFHLELDSRLGLVITRKGKKEDG